MELRGVSEVAVEHECSLCVAEAGRCWWHRGDECEPCVMAHCVKHKPPLAGEASHRPQFVGSDGAVSTSPPICGQVPRGNSEALLAGDTTSFPANDHGGGHGASRVLRVGASKRRPGEGAFRAASLREG